MGTVIRTAFGSKTILVVFWFWYLYDPKRTDLGCKTVNGSELFPSNKSRILDATASDFDIMSELVSGQLVAPLEIEKNMKY
jgi:hypothetical protein